MLSFWISLFLSCLIYTFPFNFHEDQDDQRERDLFFAGPLFTPHGRSCLNDAAVRFSKIVGIV